MNPLLTTDSLKSQKTPVLTYAAFFGLDEAVDTVLNRDRIKVNATNDFGLIALMFAAINSNPKIAESLLNKDAYTVITNNAGHTALDLARKYANNTEN